LKQDIVLVHGGGKHVDQWMEKLGNQPTMIDGRRVTDALSLELAVMNYAGLINKSLVSSLQALKRNALGLSGADLRCITSVKRQHPTIDFGYVGDVTKVNSEVFQWLLQHQVTPVCCAITADQGGQLLNTNADTIAAEIASALASMFRVSLWYCFEKKGVLENVSDENSVVASLTQEKYREMLNRQLIHTGMLPKLKNCFDALNAGVQKVYITDYLGIQNIPIPSGTKISIQ
ncbi:MAG: acetylglutamate kinase, partial [Saprospiraceae bacterium]|nr:acetylglutamate kinase [Saprospiraceae bacterium]